MFNKNYQIMFNKTHGDYSSYKPIMIIYIKTHENITLFHSNCLPYHIISYMSSTLVNCDKGSFLSEMELGL